MSHRFLQAGYFRPTPEKQGDPEKLAYFNTPNWQGKTRVGAAGALKVDSRACPGCMFPDAPAGKWPHIGDARCRRAALP